MHPNIFSDNQMQEVASAAQAGTPPAIMTMASSYNNSAAGGGQLVHSYDNVAEEAQLAGYHSELVGANGTEPKIHIVKVSHVNTTEPSKATNGTIGNNRGNLTSLAHNVLGFNATALDRTTTALSSAKKPTVSESGAVLPSHAVSFAGKDRAWFDPFGRDHFFGDRGDSNDNDNDYDNENDDDEEMAEARALELKEAHKSQEDNNDGSVSGVLGELGLNGNGEASKNTEHELEKQDEFAPAPAEVENKYPPVQNASFDTNYEMDVNPSQPYEANSGDSINAPTPRNPEELSNLETSSGMAPHITESIEALSLIPQIQQTTMAAAATTQGIPGVEYADMQDVDADRADPSWEDYDYLLAKGHDVTLPVVMKPQVSSVPPATSVGSHILPLPTDSVQGSFATSIPSATTVQSVPSPWPTMPVGNQPRITPAAPNNNTVPEQNNNTVPVQNKTETADALAKQSEIEDKNLLRVIATFLHSLSYWLN